MTKLILASAFAALAFTAAGASAQAANARHPYENVDHRNDNGNDTGDSQVERLNAQQLGQTPAVGAPMDRATMPMATPGTVGGYAQHTNGMGRDQTTIGGEE